MKGMLLFLMFLATRAMAGMVTCEELRITVPDGWKSIDGAPAPVLFTAESPKGEFLQVSLKRPSPRIVVDDRHVQAFKRGMLEKASRVGPERKTTVGGRPAVAFEFDATRSGGVLNFFVWLMAYDDGVYCVLLSFPNAAKRQKLIDSITFVPSARGQ